MKKVSIYALILVLVSLMASAIDVGVVVDMPDGTVFNDCVDVSLGSDGKATVETSSLFTTTWTDFGGSLGWSLTTVNGVSDNNAYWSLWVPNDGQTTFESAALGWSGYNITEGGLVLAQRLTGFGEPYPPTLKPAFSSYNTLCQKLAITDLDVEVGDEEDKNLKNGDKISDDAKPGDVVVFKVELSNQYNDDDEDFEIEDVEVTITIDNIDDGDELEETVDVGDISADDKEDFEVAFRVPYGVDEDDYTVLIEVEGEDENGVNLDFAWTLTLKVKKDSHELIFQNIDFSTNPVSCNRQTELDTRIVNIGDKDEDVELSITNSALGINIDQSFEIEEGSDDNTFTTEHLFTIPDSVGVGTYPVRVEAVYDDGGETLTETVSLVVEDCSSIPMSIPAATPVMQQPEETVEEIIIEVPAATGAVAAVPVAKNTGAGITTILIVALEILAVLVGVGLFVWLLKK